MTIVFEALFKGWVGELKTKATQRFLLDSKHYRVFNSVIIPRGEGTTQIDHVVVSKYGVFVVETKQRSGWIFGGKKDAQWTENIYGRKLHFQNPLRQNYLHTKTLAETLRIEDKKIHSLIVFWGDCEFKTRMPEEVVKGVSGWRDYMENKKRVLLTDNEVDRICTQLKTIKENTPVLQGLKHAYTLHKKYASSSVCPKCGGRLLVRNSARGKFLGCKNYPRCRYTKEL
jgi:restriction system protein